MDRKRRHFFVERLENRRLLAGDWAPTEVEGPAVHSVAVGVTDDGVPSRAASVPVVFSAGFIPEIDVVGNGHSIEEGDATPDLLDFTDFGTVGVDGELITRTYRIENIGTGTLNLTGSPRVAMSGANAGDFTVTLQPPESIDAGDSRDFTVEFNPGAEGVRTATISIRCDDDDESPYEFNIHGTGGATRDPLDINRDGRVSALDALAIINQINRTLTNQEQSSAENVDRSRYDYDANGDGKVSTLDALLVINHVRSGVDGGGNTVPVANDDAYTVENGQLQLTATDGVLANDADAEGNRLTARVISQPTKGELIFSSDGSFSYTAQQEGTDSFSYVAEDGQGESNVALVSIVVLPPPPPPTQETCLDQTGPLITLSGSQSALVDLDVEPQTKFDATSATWYATGNTRIELSGDNLCWHGGLVEHNWPADQDWNTTHDDHAFKLSSRNLVVENVQIKTAGDGISIYEGTDDFLVRGVYMEDIRDDAIEHDWLGGGKIEDTLINGAYVAFAARSRDGTNVDGSNNTWIINNTLAWLRPQIGVYKGPSPGHGGFFKWEQTDNAPMLSLHNNIFMVGQEANHQDLGVPQGKLIDASNNIVVWLGEGDFPDPLPDGFTITTDRSVWDNAVADWMSRHQSVSAIASEVTEHQSSISSAGYTATVDTATVDTATVDTATVDTATNLEGASLLPSPLVQQQSIAVDVGSYVTRSSGSEAEELLDWSEWQLDSDLVDLLAEEHMDRTGNR